MSASDTRIPVSTDIRRELRIVKAERDMHTYDDAIRHLLGKREDGL